MTATLRIISPVDGSIYAERPLADAAAVGATLERAREAQREWRHVPVAERCRIATAFVDAMVVDTARVSELLAWQMGRPIRYGPGEVRGFEERARYMIAVAPEMLADIDVGPKDGFKRFIRREPLGVVLNLPAWNFPYMTALNAVLPAILAGNVVVMKHSSQTALVAEHFADCFKKANLPNDVFQFIHMSHEATEAAIRSGLVDQVGFTGSTAGGRAIMAAVVAAPNFPATCLELGGKDPAYVRPDANLTFAIENIVDGGYFNTGQSCCAVERIYVHEAVYDKFVEGAVATINGYKLGSPADPETTLGPLVRLKAADHVRDQVKAAISRGARALIDPRYFREARSGTPYLAPQLLVDVDHSMAIMTEETFGPAHGIMKVKSDEEAIRLMNDSPFGLTASIWTEDVEAALRIGDAIETGTVYMNRADYLDPALAWVGVKESGRGVTLSKVGYEHLTRPKSFHLRTRTGWTMLDRYPSLKANWSYPTAIRFGPGRIIELPAALAAAGIKRPLFVTDPGLVNLPIVATAIDILDQVRVRAAVFSKVDGNPTLQNLEDGLAAYKAAGSDGVIAFGGGSAMDIGKLVAFMSGQRRPVFDFEDREDWWTRADAKGIAPVVAVPTTAGTGSEVGRAAVVTDPDDHTKKIIFHPQMLPRAVIADPELSVGLPPKITAWTGMDALSHSLESWCSPFFHPLGEGIALEGMRLVKEWLPVAVAEGGNIEARSFMLAASSMGAVAFQKGLGAMHAMSHPCSSLRGTHHGLTNAVVMPYVLAHNRAAVEARLAALARYLDLPGHSATSVIDWTLALRKKIGIPETLKDIGVDADIVPEAAPMAERDPSTGGNPVPMKARDYEVLYRRAIAGTL